MTDKTQTYSCPSLHHALYLGPDMLRHCCKRFFVDGELRGDAEIFPVKNDHDVDVNRIVQAKRDLYEAINRGEETQCSGCPFLVLDDWDPLDELRIDFLSVESHSVCNMRCSYCGPTYYGGLRPNYDLKSFLKRFVDSDAFAEDINIAWGGGEPTLTEDFEETFELFAQKLQPKTNHLFTNAIKYSPVIAQHLRDGTATVTISTDAGTKETFTKVRGAKAFDKVFANIKKYHDIANRGVTIKYIFTGENSSLGEVNKFLELIRKYKLNDCDCQLSSNFKTEELSDEQMHSVVHLYRELVKNGAKTCHIDDHLRPRFNKKLIQMTTASTFETKDFQFFGDKFSELKDEQFVIWGAGQLAYLMIRDSLLLAEKRIAFFVDKDKKKQGNLLCNIEVKSPEHIKNVDHPIIIASSRFYEEIYRELIGELGISENRIMGGLIV